MDGLSPSLLLEVWEQGAAQPAPQQALLLLGAAFPEESADALAQLSIGQRNALLLTLREWLFGPHFVSGAACPQCAERVELTFEAGDIRAGGNGSVAPLLHVDLAGYAVDFRLPNSADLVAVAGAGDPPAIERAVLERCVVSVRHTGKDTPARQLPAEVATAVIDAMDRADPQANIQLSLTCPACGHAWQAFLDLLPYVWRELDAWAHRALRDVHYLASAYGWSEREILNMRPSRRQIYLDMIGV
ncbi:MAG TPA: phage baseplate protein [Halothiobacillaceae bacterium]|nr:phage baseplate protein [Halothiobacillaceae bacterium]